MWGNLWRFANIRALFELKYLEIHGTKIKQTFLWW
jgi:hypothetical protein